MPKPVEGKVAKILDDRTLILNIGHAAGVVQGMVFCIYAPVEEVNQTIGRGALEYAISTMS